MAAQEVLPFPDFAYRKNADGSYDSICLECFQTVATGKRVDELAGREFLHALECFAKKRPLSDHTAR
jgi:hypothetical protein